VPGRFNASAPLLGAIQKGSGTALLRTRTETHAKGYREIPEAHP
jgi:hypothetical protein